MIYRKLNIGSWDCHFFFAVKEYEEEDIIDLLYDLDAPDWVIVDASRKIRRSEPNEADARGSCRDRPYNIRR